MANLDRITPATRNDGWQTLYPWLRITVGMIVGQIGAGRSIEDVLVDYPYLEREDILQALR